MKPLNQLNSWPVLWHIADELSQMLQGFTYIRAFTFQKRRLDILFEHGETLNQVTWLIQNNTPLLFLPNTASLAKKHVHLFQEIPQNLILKAVKLSSSDRLLLFEFSQGYTLEFGFFPKARNVIFKKDGSLVRAFLKSEQFPESTLDYATTTELQTELLANRLEFPGNAQHQELFNALESRFFNSDDFIQSYFDADENEFNGISHAIQIHRRPQKKAFQKAESVGVVKAGKSLEKRWLKKIDKLQQDLQKSADWETTEYRAQLLQLAIAYKMQQKDGIIHITDDQNDGVTIDIKVDPSKPLHENMASLYKKAKKQRLKLQEIEPIIQQTQEDIVELHKLIESNDEKPLQLYLESHGIRLATKKNETVEHKPYKIQQSPSGLDIFIGKSASDNDILTFKVANKYDWWFHARGVHGSHVILRTGKAELRHDDKLFVAQLAAQYSDDRNSGVVAVQYAQKRHLTKPKGTPPGFVVINKEEVIFIEP